MAERYPTEDVSADKTEPRPVSLSLILSDFVLVERFRGFYEDGHRYTEVESAHMPFINGKWKYDKGSPKLTLLGNEIEPGDLHISPTSSRDDTKRSHIDHEYVVIYMMENVFRPLSLAIQCRDIEEALLRASAETNDVLDGRYKLLFGRIEIVHRPVAQSEAPAAAQEAPTAGQSEAEANKRIERKLDFFGEILCFLIGILAGIFANNGVIRLGFSDLTGCLAGLAAFAVVGAVTWQRFLRGR
jgi:hypothetical protein